MAAKIDFDTLLDQTFWGLDILTMLGDVEDFIEFSESNIGWQKHRELRRTEQECNDFEFDDPHLEAQYRHQALEGVEFRFEVSLTQRVRYATLIALITTVEWVLLTLKKRASFKFPRKPDKQNEAIYVLSEFNKKMNLGLEEKILILEALVKIRNCIVHDAGLLASSQYENDLRHLIPTLLGIRISNLNFLGEGIEIETGFIQGVIRDVRVWLPNLEKVASAQKLLRK